MSSNQYKRDLKSHDWRMTRERIIDRSFGVCDYCGEATYCFEVHHEKYIGKHPSDTPDEHLKAVCPKCHDVKHWSDRLRMYSERKRELLSMGVHLTEEKCQALIREFRV